MDTLDVAGDALASSLTIDSESEDLLIQLGIDSELDILVGEDQRTVSSSASVVVQICSDGVTVLNLTPPEDTTLILSLAEPGPPGPAGGAPAPVSFDLVAAAEFSAAHGFGYDPEVQLVSGGRRVYAGADYPNSSTVHVLFPLPFTGKVVLR